ncbi:uncharacterized protein [Physcomitrium patens]|uniref:uncharacterized protein isoform X2 n=1 Tax=Physcomitrium patens TaxID=3218 RepID=UPI00024B1219
MYTTGSVFQAKNKTLRISNSLQIPVACASEDYKVLRLTMLYICWTGLPSGSCFPK